MDFLERRMSSKMGYSTPIPMMSAMVPVQPEIPVKEIIPKKSGKKSKFTIPNDPEGIIEAVVDSKPSTKDLRKAMEKYIKISSCDC